LAMNRDKLPNSCVADLSVAVGRGGVTGLAGCGKRVEIVAKILFTMGTA
jgi:hypothetical protein